MAKRGLTFKAIYHSSGVSIHNDTDNPSSITFNSNCGADIMGRVIIPSGDSGQVHRYAYLNAVGINKRCNIAHAINPFIRGLVQVK